jgi:hypothetical protein
MAKVSSGNITTTSQCQHFLPWNCESAELWALRRQTTGPFSAFRNNWMFKEFSGSLVTANSFAILET